MLATANTGKIGRGFGKNVGDWTGRVEIIKEEIPGSKRSMYGYILTHSRRRPGERLSSVFSTDGTLTAASAAHMAVARPWKTAKTSMHIYKHERPEV